MQNRTIYALAAVGCLFVFAWVLAAPVLQLPIGASVATGESMGTNTPQFHIWVDSEPEVGDIVAFDTHGTAYDGRTAHRVVAETDRGYITKGDANSYRDQELESIGPVTDETLVGVVVVRMPLWSAVAVCMLASILPLTSQRKRGIVCLSSSR